MEELLMSFLGSFLTGGSDTKQSAPTEPQATAANTGSHVSNLINTFGGQSMATPPTAGNQPAQQPSSFADSFQKSFQERQKVMTMSPAMQEAYGQSKQADQLSKLFSSWGL